VFLKTKMGVEVRSNSPWWPQIVTKSATKERLDQQSLRYTHSID
jgi:hypothetical protein